MTAAVSQVWAANPQLNYRQVVEILQATATDVNALGWDQETGAGLLNVAAAVHLAKVTAGEVLVSRVPVPVVVNQASVDDSAVATERPLLIPGTGTPVRVPVEKIVMSRPVVQALAPFTLAAAQSIISNGIKVLASPLGILGALAAASVGMIVWAGVAYYDLKKAEAEAAANTAADVWCVANPQECHANDPSGRFIVRGWMRPGIPSAWIPIPVGAAFTVTTRIDRYNRNLNVVYHPSCPLGCDLGLVSDGSPQVVWEPNGNAATKTWNQLSAGAKQAVFDSGLLSKQLGLKALSSGIGGFLAPGSLDSQGLRDGLMVLDGNTIKTIQPVRIDACPPNARWEYKAGLGWVCFIPGSDKAYSPIDIPFDQQRRDRPPFLTKDDNGVPYWEIPRASASPSPSGSSSGSGGSGSGSPSGCGAGGQARDVYKLVDGARRAIDRLSTGNSTPVGRRNYPIKVAPGTNKSATINGREFTGHALDQMQGRGLTPSVVENTIQTGEKIEGKTANTTAYYDSVNNITVITNTSSGRVVTASFGRIRQ